MDLDSILQLVPMLGLALAIVVPLVLVTVVVFVARSAMRKASGARGGPVGEGVFAQLGQAMDAGRPYPHQEEAERSGFPSQAVILDTSELASVVKGHHVSDIRGVLILEVRPPNAARFRVRCEQWFLRSEWTFFIDNKVIPVRIHPQNPQLVFFDRQAHQAARQHAEQAQREEQARHQAALLAQKPE